MIIYLHVLCLLIATVCFRKN